MAFNPFSWFRKHQKVFFAGLTILCMFVFVLSFGRGDFFEQMLSYIGGRRSGGPTVVTLNGVPFNEADLAQVQRRRRMADEFLMGIPNATAGVIQLGQMSAIDEMVKGELKEEPLLLITLENARRIAMGMERQNIQRNLNQGFITLNDEARRFKDKPEGLRLVARVGAVLSSLAWQLGRRSASDLYMGGDTGIDSLLDFSIWRQQADKLGITLTDADVMAEINAEAAGHTVFDPKVRPFDRERVVSDFIRSKRDPRLKASDLMAALRDEFRVAMARETVTGEPSGARRWRMATEGASASPAIGTPDEFLAYYRDMTTAVKVRLLRVPVESFLKDAKSDPSESDLHSLFTRFREVEATPISREPGFKESRQIKPEFVLGSATDPYYVAQGRAAVRGQPTGKPASGGLAHIYEDWRRARDSVLLPAMPAVGAGPGVALAIACGIGFDPVQIEHSRLLDKSHLWAFENPPSPEYPELRMDPHVQTDPAAIATLFLGLAGDRRSAVNTLWLTSQYRAAKPALRKNLALLMGPVSGSLPDALAFAALSIIAQPQPFTRALAEPQILAAMQETYAIDALESRMAEFTKKVRSYAGKTAPAGELEKLAKASHFVYGTTPKVVTEAELSDQMRLKNDMGLGALRKKFEEIAPKTQSSELAFHFFRMAATFTPLHLFLDLSNLDREQSNFIFPRMGKTDRGLLWLGESNPPKILEYAEARPAVEAAFKFDAARDLARKAAVDLVAKINAKNGTARDALALLAEAKAINPRLGPLVELDNVALQTPQQQNLAERKTSYRRYDLPEDVQTEMPYVAPEDLARQLLELKRPGEAKVVVDRPGRNFFVAVLEARSPQTFDEFRRVYSRTPDRDDLYEVFLRRKREEFYRSVVEQLRREATGGQVDKNGFIKVSEEVRKRFTGNVSDD